jgi:hypothetical protein
MRYHGKNLLFYIGLLSVLVRCGSSATGAIAGTYTVTALSCNAPANPTAATGLVGAWVTSPSTMVITVSSTAFSSVWNNGSCTMTQNGTVSLSGATLVFTNTGTFGCTGTGCSTYSTSLFGSNRCSTTVVATETLTYSPSSGVSVNGTATLTQASATTPICSALGQTDYLRYAVTRTL